MRVRPFPGVEGGFPHTKSRHRSPIELPLSAFGRANTICSWKNRDRFIDHSFGRGPPRPLFYFRFTRSAFSGWGVEPLMPLMDITSGIHKIWVQSLTIPSDFPGPFSSQSASRCRELWDLSTSSGEMLGASASALSTALHPNSKFVAPYGGTVVSGS